MTGQQEDEKFNYLFTDREAVMVDVIMPTYNHEVYIKQALESVINKKTQYSFRLIVGEDSSTDRTREYVMGYREKYPDKIDVILSKKNWGPNITGIPMLKSCNAKYVAYLDGDDYWADDLKLEKQVSFLESRKDFIGITGNVQTIDQSGNILQKNYELYQIRDAHVYGRKQASQYEMVSQINSLINRNIYKEWNEKQWEYYAACKANGDLRISVLLGMQGRIFFARDIMSFHRRVFQGDSWTSKTYGKDMRWTVYKMKKAINDCSEKMLGVLCSSRAELANNCFKDAKEVFLMTANKSNGIMVMKFLLEKWYFQMRKMRGD